MNEIKITSFNDFIDKTTQYHELDIFRGLNKSAYELVPKVARNKTPEVVRDFESDLIALFCQWAPPYLNHKPLNKSTEDKLEWLAIAQHHGLPTKLLDWSNNPLVALFFAVSKNLDHDGAVCVYKVKMSNDGNNTFDHLSGIETYFPKHISERISAQSSIFTVHLNPSAPMESDEQLDKLIIPKEEKLNIQLSLNKLDINKMKLFPGLDGICEYLRWLKGYN